MLASTLPLVFFALAAVTLSYTDLRFRTIPTSLVVSLYLAFVLSVTVMSFVLGSFTDGRRAVLAGIACFVVALILAVATPKGLGGGDVKLIGFVTTVLAWLGWVELLLGILFAAFLIGGVAAYSLFRRKRRQAELPLAPLIFAASSAAILLTNPVAAVGAS